MSKLAANLLKPLLMAGLMAFAAPALAQTTPPATPPATPAATPATSDGAVPLGGNGDNNVNAPASDNNPVGLNMGQAVADPNAPGTVYVRDTFGDWQLRCTRAPKGEKERCLIYQLLRDPKKGLPVAEITMFHLPAGQQATAGATIIVPLETLLTRQLTLAVDTGPTKRYPFTWCSKAGCFARIGFSNADVASFRRGAVATLTIVPVQAPTQTVELKISLKGFSKAFDAVTAANK